MEEPAQEVVLVLLVGGLGGGVLLPGLLLALLPMVRDAREIWQRTFTSNDVLGKAAAAADVLWRIAPDYDPKALEEG